MKYGPHTDSVSEIFQFVHDGALFAPSPKLPDDVAVVTKLDTAMELAWETDYGTEKETWENILDKYTLLVDEALDESPELIDIKETLYYEQGAFSRLVFNSLSEDYKEMEEDIAIDLWNCINARVVQGETNVFFEKLFEIYKCGGWPCGWEGDYPEGRIAAYFPNPPADS